MTSFSVTGFAGILSRLLPEPHAGLLTGLLFGTKTSLPNELYEALLITGTIHIVALSGMNIAIMSRLIQGSLVSLVGRRISCLLTLLAICWFVTLVGFGASIVRAAIMGSIAIFAVLSGRQYWGLGAWVLAVGSMLLINMAWAGDISFQLSVLATLGILLFGSERKGMHEITENSRHDGLSLFDRLVQGIRDDLRLTLAAQALTIPVIVFHFHRISLVAPAANLMIGWIIAPLTALGWVTVLLGFVSAPLARFVAWVDWLALEYIVRTIYMMSFLPFASVGR